MQPAIRVLMMPRDTNAHGTIFGGVILSYIDQAGAIEARRQGLNLMVTVSMDKVVFHEPVFVGDLVDRGPNTPAVLKLVMNMVRAGHAHCVAGNHDVKLARKLFGRDVKLTHGLAESIAQLDSESPEFRTDAAKFMDKLVSHYVFDGGKLVAADAARSGAFPAGDRTRTGSALERARQG